MSNILALVMTSLSETVTEILAYSLSFHFLYEEVFSFQIIVGTEMTNILSSVIAILCMLQL